MAHMALSFERRARYLCLGPRPCAHAQICVRRGDRAGCDVCAVAEFFFVAKVVY